MDILRARQTLSLHSCEVSKANTKSSCSFQRNKTRLACCCSITEAQDTGVGRAGSRGKAARLDDGALGEDAELAVHLAIGVLLDADDFQLKGALELRVRDVRLGEAHPSGPDEALILWRLAGEALAYKRRLRTPQPSAELALSATRRSCNRIQRSLGSGNDTPRATEASCKGPWA